MFRQDLKRGLTSWGFWLGTVVFASSLILITLAFTPSGDGAETPLNVFSAAFMGQIAYLPPLLCVLPLGTVFYDEWSSRFYRLSVSRVGWQHYTLKRVLSGAVLGGLGVMLPACIALFFCYSRFQVIPTSPHASTFFGMMYKFPLMRCWVPWQPAAIAAFTPMQHVRAEALYALAWLGNLFLFGACWAQLGLAVSAWADDWAMVLVAPFVIFMFLNWIGSRLQIPWLTLRDVIAQSGEILNYPYWMLQAVPFIWGLLFVLVFMMGMRRRKSLG